MKLLLIIVLSLLIISILSCNKDSITSPPDDNSIPGRRDYAWTVDTIDAPNDPMGRMWGSSPNDLWTTSDGYWDKSISHFNGEKWSSYGIWGINTPWAVYGFSNTEVFIGAENGQIWKYNGYNWTKFAELTKNGHTDLHFENIWGESPDDFYAVGAYTDVNTVYNKTVIAHYVNGNWNMINTGSIEGTAVHLFKNDADNKIYLNLVRIGLTEFIDSTNIYEYKNSKFYKIYGSQEIKGIQADINLINNEVIFVLGNRIARRYNNQFYTILNIDNQNFYQRIWGRSSKDIFLLMTDGLAHYNGTDVEYLFHFTFGDVKPWTQIFGGAIFENDVFFLVYEPTTHLNLIYHGLLNTERK